MQPHDADSATPSWLSPFPLPPALRGQCTPCKHCTGSHYGTPNIVKEKQGEKSEAPGESWRWLRPSSSSHGNARRRTSTQDPYAVVDMVDCPEEDLDGEIAEDVELMGMLPTTEWEAFRALSIQEVG